MYDYITWEDLKTRWKKLDSQLLKYLQKGLQPYSLHENSIPCPMKYHEYYHLHFQQSKDKQSIKWLEKSLNYDPENGRRKTKEEKIKELKQRKIIKEKIKELKKRKIAYQNKMNKIEEDDLDCISWKYFINPQADGELDKIVSDLRNAIFKEKDVHEFEKIHNLKPIQTGKETEEPKKTKGYRPSRTHRDLCRKKALEIWVKDNTITIADMCKHYEIKAIAKNKSGKPYAERTIRGWISDLCPDRSPGRRPQKDK